MRVRAGSITVVTAFLMLGVGQAHAQTQDSAPKFEAVAIRQVDAGVRSAIRGGPGTSDPGRIDWVAPLWFVIQRAFNIESDQLTKPGWLDSINWEIVATYPATVTPEQFRQMLQDVLAERFHLRFHRDTKNFPAYDLTVGKNGPKLKVSEYVPPPNPRIPNTIYTDAVPVFVTGGGGTWTLTGRAATIANLSKGLRPALHARVIDKTGLTGKYDFTITYGDGTSSGPTSLTAGEVRERLGLELKETKLSLPVIVVDSIDRTPTDN